MKKYYHVWCYQGKNLCWLLNYPWYLTGKDGSTAWLMPVILFQHWSQNNVIYTSCNLDIYILYLRLQNVAWDLSYFWSENPSMEKCMCAIEVQQQINIFSMTFSYLVYQQYFKDETCKHAMKELCNKYSGF